jgi:hypothetical protein
MNFWTLIKAKLNIDSQLSIRMDHHITETMNYIDDILKNIAKKSDIA